MLKTTESERLKLAQAEISKLESESKVFEEANQLEKYKKLQD